MLTNLFIVFINGLIEVGSFVVSETIVMLGFLVVWQFSRWELAREYDLSVGIGPEEELL